MLVYQNNFPRENAVKGQKFEGDKALEEELLGRKIIGEGEITSEADTSKDTEANATLSAKVEELTEANATLSAKNDEEVQAEITRLHSLIEEAISLPRGQVPEGYKKAK
jgi:hypothetical protein